jgi:chromosome segregation ATPase
MESQPIILFMEWSKNPRLVPSQEVHDIDSITAPDETSLQLREEVDILKLKLDTLQSRKQELIHRLNDVNDSTAIARATCEGLDDLCEAIRERLECTTEALTRERNICQELQTRIKRDKHKAIVGEFASKLDRVESESTVLEYIISEVSKSNEPDDLLQRITNFQQYHHRKMKDAQRMGSQLRTTVASIKKQIEESEKRLIIAERSRIAAVTKASQGPTRPDTKTRPIPRVVDRKIVPLKQSANFADDDLAPSRKRANNNFGNIFH